MYKIGSIGNIPDLSLLNELKLFNDEPYEDLIWVQKTIIDSELYELWQQIQDLSL